MGEDMGIYEEATEWFNRHHTVRKIVKGTIFATLGLIVATQLEIVTWLEMQVMAVAPEWMPLWFLIKPGIIGAFVGLGNWLQHNTTLPIVGAKAKKKRK